MSGYMLLGILVILIPLFVYMTHDRIKEHERHTMVKELEKGQALIRSFEGGARAGMMNRQWGAARLQRLLTEISFQPDIRYMMITTSDGQIRFHSVPEKVGKLYDNMPKLPADAALNSNDEGREIDSYIFHRIVDQPGADPVFEIYKQFRPDRKKGKGKHHRFMAGFENMMGPGHPKSDKWKPPCDVCPKNKLLPGPGDGHTKEKYYIFAGLSLSKAKQKHQRFISQIVTKGILFLSLGLVGIFSLFVFQGYRSAKSRLTKIQAFSDTVVDHMPAGLMTLDKQFNVVSFNAAAADILGAQPVTLPGEVRRLIEEADQPLDLIQEEVQCTSLTGETQLLDISVSPLSGDVPGAAPEGDVSVPRYMLLFKDLTELDLLKKEVETSRRMAAIGKLAAGVAHEIRNPLSSIKGFATYFKERYADVAQDRQTAEIMVQEVERLNRSVTQLLEFAKPIQMNLKPVELDDLIDHAVKLAAHDLEQKNIKVQVDTGQLPKRMVTDPDRMNQVLLNLFLNSIQAMEEHGELKIHAGMDKGEEQVQIRVEDTGKGIEPNDLEKVFDPYFTTRNDGTGLGLAIVHRIIESLKGEIRIQSTPGKGTRVMVTLPVREEGQ